MNTIRVGISEYVVAGSPDRLVTIGLGSCVGIAVYNADKKVGGLSHILLPDSTFFTTVDRPEKFADLALPLMVDEIRRKTGTGKLVAKIAGGASMFLHENESLAGGIGSKNIEAVIRTLGEMEIPIISAHTGGNNGRTMSVDLETFDVTISTGSKEIVIL
jgi:chemotaxis protein CheD